MLCRRVERNFARARKRKSPFLLKAVPKQVRHLDKESAAILL